MHNTSAGPDAAASDSAGLAIAAWFGERLPSEWTVTAPKVTVDREEIIVILAVPSPEPAGAAATPEPGSPEATSEAAGSSASSDDAAAAANAQARSGRIARFREE